MKILLIGGTGTIGTAIVGELGSRHEIMKAGSKSGNVTVDITSTDSIQNMFKSVGKVDAVVCTAGAAHFGPLETLTEKEFETGIRSKLMGQINLVLIGIRYVNDGGSFTVTTGVLTHDPIYCGVAVTTVNAGLEGFVLSASIEMPRGIRINAVSPEVLEESMEKIGAFFRGHVPVPGKRVALAYSKSVEGRLNGQVFQAT
ncbi:MAG: short chain dehydrogenase [Nitrospirota bacterium]|nr:short chain dehydrogenase [Nitrospirota bacterium]